MHTQPYTSNSTPERICYVLFVLTSLSFCLLRIGLIVFTYRRAVLHQWVHVAYAFIHFLEIPLGVLLLTKMPTKWPITLSCFLIILLAMNAYLSFQYLLPSYFWIEVLWTLPVFAVGISKQSSNTSFWVKLALTLFLVTLPLAVVEGVFLEKTFRSKYRLPDYGFMHLNSSLYEMLPGGRLKPDIQTWAVGPRNPIWWQTNSQGFRYYKEVAQEPPVPTRRVLYIGDSFVAGYRTDQKAQSASLLEENLRKGNSKEVSVLPVCLEDVSFAWYYLDEIGLSWNPDHVVFCLCLNNDLAQTYVLTHEGAYLSISEEGGSLNINRQSAGEPTFGFHRDEIFNARLPAESFAGTGAFGPVVYSVVNRLRQIQTVSVLLSLRDSVQPVGVAPMWPGPVKGPRLFDLGHGLGACLKDLPTPMKQAYSKTKSCLLGLAQDCKVENIPFTVVVIPQRYAVSAREWQATIRRYHLVPEFFDPLKPHREITDFLKNASIDYVDLLPAFCAYDNPTELFLPMGDMHWSPQGHALAAKVVYEHIKED